MKPGVSLKQADEQLHVIDKRYQAANPEKVDAKAGMSVVPFHEDLVGRQRPMLLTLFAAVGCVLAGGVRERRESFARPLHRAPQRNRHSHRARRDPRAHRRCNFSLKAC